MNRLAIIDRSAFAPTLPFTGVRAHLLHAGLIAAAVILPAVAHLTGAPVRVLLPMHWPVILAGIVFGWRAGMLAGLASPAVSYLCSGMPFPDMIPGMTIELACYGFIAGFLRERTHLSAFVSVLIALVVGRLALLGASFLAAPASLSSVRHLGAALLPGLPVAVAQVLTLPLLAGWWIRQARRS